MSHGLLNATEEMVAAENKPTVPPSGNMAVLFPYYAAP